MLTCEEFAKSVTDYLEGSSPLSARMQFLLHKTLCGHCNRFYTQIRITRDLLKHIPTAPTTPEQRAALLEQFRTLDPDPDIDLPDEVSSHDG